MSELLPFEAHLLPRHSSVPEKALASLYPDAFDLPFPIDTLWNPWSCPSALLPWLAWALSVDVWDPSWPEDRKRSAIAQLPELHRLKGTLEGIRRHAALVGGDLVRAHVPPSLSFLSADLSLAERQEHMRSLPEIRVRTRSDPGDAGMSFFSGPLGTGGIASFDSDEADVIPAFLVESPAAQLLGRRAELHDRGVVTPLLIDEVVDEAGRPLIGADRFFVPGDGTGGSFLDAGPAWTLFICPPRALARIITISVAAEALDGLDGLVAARDGFEPQPLVPTYVRERGVAPDGIFSDACTDGFHFVESRAALFQYESIRLHDPSRDVMARSAISYMGTERFGMDPRTAELAISVTDRRSHWAADDFVWGFFVATPPDKLNRVLDAVQAAKSARDRILIDTEVHRAPTFGGDLYFGAFRWGVPVKG